MSDPFFLIQIATLILGFYMAWNIGANDVANAMGTSVGSKALSLKKAVLLAAVLEFSGAFFAGSSVSETIQRRIVEPTIFQADPITFALGMMGALLATSLLLQLASYLKLPISTTHAIVGALVGFGIVLGGVHSIYWKEILWIVLSWIFSPLLSGIFAFGIFTLIQKKILFALDPVYASKKLMPYFAFFCFLILTMSALYHGLNLDISLKKAFFTAFLIGLIAFFLSQRSLKKKQIALEPALEGFHPRHVIGLEKALHHLERVRISQGDASYSQAISSIVGKVHELKLSIEQKTPLLHSSHQHHGVEKIFVPLQITSACLVAFAHGSNDVANAIGPVAAVFKTVQSQSVESISTTPLWLLILGGAGIVFGLATWGWRVIDTVGKKITELTPTRGFAAEFGAALTILFASKLGLPISTTHALIGAILGVGIGRGIKAINLRTIREIAISWVITIPLCAGFSILCFYALRMLILGL